MNTRFKPENLKARYYFGNFGEQQDDNIKMDIKMYSVRV
jgi:hypothetical protein